MHYLFDRTRTYKPFRQQLQLTIDNQGNISWQYEFFIYNPKSLSFWKPNDTMGVNTPEFRDQPYVTTPVCISGTVAKSGSLEFKDLKFGGIGYSLGNPNLYSEKT